MLPIFNDEPTTGMQRIYKWLEQAYRVLLFYIKGIFTRFMEEDVFLWAAAIAFKMLIAFIPLIILTTGTIGWLIQSFLQDSPLSPTDTLERFLQTFLPQYHSESVISGIHRLASSGQQFTLFGSISLFFLSISLFTSLQTIVSHIFKEQRKHRHLLRAYLFDLRMVVQIGFFFVLSILLTIILTGIKATGADYLTSFHQFPQWLSDLWDGLANGILSYLLPLLATMGMFFQVYYFVPEPHPPFRSVVVGTFFTALSWEVAKNFFAWYATTLRPFERYSESPDALVPSLGDFFGITMALVFWAYYSGVVFIIGGMIAALHEKHLNIRSAVQDAPAIPKKQTLKRKPSKQK